MVEEWKWRGVPVWEDCGIICTGETYKAVVKMTFATGAALKDPAKLFNSSLEGNVRRAIDIAEGDKINERALKDLIRAAVDLNRAKKKPGKKGKASMRRVRLAVMGLSRRIHVFRCSTEAKDVEPGSSPAHDGFAQRDERKKPPRHPFRYV